MISPIENNGMIARLQDVSIIRSNEDNQSYVAQTRMVANSDNKADEVVHTVRNKDNADNPDTRHDAKEEGRNKYYSNRNGKKKESKPKDGVVVAKSAGGFDVSI